MKIKAPKPMKIPRHKGKHSIYSWHPEMHEDKILRVTKSSLGKFSTCEQQYFISYPLGVKEPENDNMIRGTNVHDAYELILDRSIDLGLAIKIKQEEGYDGVLAYFKSLIPPSQVRKGWGEEYAKPTGNEYSLEEPDHLERLMTAEARRFMASSEEQFLPMGNELGVDAVVDFDINGKIVPVHLSGYIDRLFLDDNGDWHVHELKTGRWKDKKTKYESMAKEMAFYVYLLKKSDDPEYGGINVKYWGWDHTNGHEDNPHEIYRFIEEVDAQIISDMLTDLKGLISAHLRYKADYNGNMFAVKPSGAERYFCEPYCAVKGFCPKYHRTAMPHEMREKAEGN